MKTTLLKRVDGLEIWATVGETAQHYVVKFGERRARVVESLAKAEALLETLVRQARLARAH